jgi:hypothetical protein
MSSITDFSISLTDYNSTLYAKWLETAAIVDALGHDVILQVTEVGSNNIIGIWYINTIALSGTTHYNITVGTGGLVSNGTLTTNDIYTISWVFNGINGSQGSQGNQGAAGAQGNQGAQGIQGIRGFQGYQGVQGTTGSGSQGAQGVQGAQGGGGGGSSETLIASNSGSFLSEGSALSTPLWYSGNNRFGGWNGDPWRDGITGPGEDLLTIDINFGVPIPLSMASGDTIKVCGNIRGKNGSTYKVSLDYFTCDDIDTTDETIGVTNLNLTSSIGWGSSGNDCFTLIADVPTGGFSACDVFIVVSFSTDFRDAETRFTYTLVHVPG